MSGTRYSCDVCSDEGHPFNLCKACYESELTKNLPLMAVINTDKDMSSTNPSATTSVEDDLKAIAEKQKWTVHRQHVEFISIIDAEQKKDQANRDKHKKKRHSKVNLSPPKAAVRKVKT